MPDATSRRFVVETWSPELAPPLEEATEVPIAAVDLEVEMPLSRWAPVGVDRPPAASVLFVDGVRRIDARLWWLAGAERPRPALCASYAAGVVHCQANATIESVLVERGVFSATSVLPIVTRQATWEPRAVGGDQPQHLINGVQQRLGALEIRAAESAGAADLTVVDGPLSGRQNVPGAVGYVKTHRAEYLPAAAAEIIGRLGPGERTPLFVTQTSWSRFSWYLRLPYGSDHPWGGVVRCEVSADQPVSSARALAELASATLPRFASRPHKEPRAPQNLYPIAGLERTLRGRLGDQALLHRQLLRAAAAPMVPGPATISPGT